ncbi:MAG: dienelactone hydrolase family protein [Janthinobacterium lividum]
MSHFIELQRQDGKVFSAYKASPANGSGPGIVLLHDAYGINDFMRATAERLAEEGYVVLVADLFWRIQPGIAFGYDASNTSAVSERLEAFDTSQAVIDIATVVAALRGLPEHVGKIGAVGYGLGGTLAVRAAAQGELDCAVSYYGTDSMRLPGDAAAVRCPLVFHHAGNDASSSADMQQKMRAALPHSAGVEQYVYPDCDHGFADARQTRFNKPAAAMAYSRTISLLRKVMGPIYDLNLLWEQHCYHEFATRDVDAVMPTMVAQPYVNHVPTMTGGVGHDQLKRFYKYHFVDVNPADTKLIPLSRTIGADRIVDEFVFCATHDREIDWLLPGLAPTGRYFEIPMLAVVCFRGDKLYNEHIYWDQASVLVQIGVLDPTGLPVSGAQTARKMIDETQPSNALMPNWASSEGKPC